ncbi:MAG: hypothetical protein ACI4AW_05040 [Paludibacteraceae bacterium]
MEFRFEGYIREIGPLETVTFKDGRVRTKRDIIITTDEQRPNTLGISFWDDDARMICNAVPKQYISVDYNAKADFVKSKNGDFLKNNLKAWRFQLGQINPNLQWAEATIPGYQQAAPQQAAPAQQAAPPQQAAPAQQVAPSQLPPQQAVPQQVALNVNGLPNPVMLNPPF